MAWKAYAAKTQPVMSVVQSTVRADKTAKGRRAAANPIAQASCARVASSGATEAEAGSGRAS